MHQTFSDNPFPASASPASFYLRASSVSLRLWLVARRLSTRVLSRSPYSPSDWRLAGEIRRRTLRCLVVASGCGRSPGWLSPVVGHLGGCRRHGLDRVCSVGRAVPDSGEDYVPELGCTSAMACRDRDHDGPGCLAGLHVTFASGVDLCSAALLRRPCSPVASQPKTIAGVNIPR